VNSGPEHWKPVIHRRDSARSCLISQTRGMERLTRLTRLTRDVDMLTQWQKNIGYYKSSMSKDWDNQNKNNTNIYDIVSTN